MAEGTPYPELKDVDLDVSVSHATYHRIATQMLGLPKNPEGELTLAKVVELAEHAEVPRASLVSAIAGYAEESGGLACCEQRLGKDLEDLMLHAYEQVNIAEVACSSSIDIGKQFCENYITDKIQYTLRRDAYGKLHLRVTEHYRYSGSGYSGTRYITLFDGFVKVDSSEDDECEETEPVEPGPKVEFRVGVWFYLDPYKFIGWTTERKRLGDKSRIDAVKYVAVHHLREGILGAIEEGKQRMQSFSFSA